VSQNHLSILAEVWNWKFWMLISSKYEFCHCFGAHSRWQ